MIGGGAAALLAGTWWLLVAHTRGAEIATDVAVPISLLGLLAALFGVSLRPVATDHPALVSAARSLVREVAVREKAEQLKLLAESGSGGRPADVEFAQPVRVYWRTDGGDRRGSLSDIADFYARLTLGRLAVLGEPGSGKTVLIDQLLLDLIARLPVQDPPAGGRLVVPIRLSLPAFDPGDADASSDGWQESLRLSAWITRHLTVVYGIASPIAAALVDEGWILPILDGLDEMDPEGQEPVKAAAAMRALNFPVGVEPRPVVIASRSARYMQLAGMRSGTGRVRVLQDATAINLEPLSVEQVLEYLTHRFPDPADPDRIDDRWRPIAEHLRRHRGRRPVTGNALVAALQSPLRLFVAVTAYATTDPAELLRIPAGRLDEHLFSQLVPAVVTQHPRPDGTHYGEREVTRWLTTIAAHLRWRAAQGASESDLDLHLLWTAAGTRRPRYVAASILGMLVVLALIPPYLWYIHTLRTWLPVNAYGWVLVAVAFGLLILGVRRAVGVPVNLQRLDLQAVGTPAGRRRLVRRVGQYLVVGLLFGAVFGIAYGLSFGLAFGIGCGASFGITFGLEQKPSITSSPRALLSQGVTHDAAVVVAFTVAFGLANGFANDLIKGLVGGVTFGMAYGFAAGAVFIAKSPWPRYFIAVRLLARDGRLPSRPAAFLDRAYTAGLLRQSGISTQFRHRELQNRLVPAAPQSSPGPVLSSQATASP